MLRYSLRQLEIFVTIAKTGKVSQAADQLALSQSAVSNALAEFERHFSMQLFDRQGKRLRLNSLGNALLPQAEAMLQRAYDLQQSLGQHTPAVEAVKLGATLSIGNYLAIDVVNQYHQHYPGRVHLSVENTSRIVDKVVRFELDVGLIEGEVNHSELLIEPWQPDELWLFCAPDHPLAHRTDLTDADLVQTSWILRESGSGTRQAFEQAMHGLVAQLDIQLQLQHIDGIKVAVERGLGISCLSRLTLRDAVRQGRFVRLMMPARNWHRELYLITHRRKYQSAAVKQLIKTCQSVTADPIRNDV